MAGEEPFLDVVADQRGCPTNAGDLAQALMEFVTSDLQGICYVTSTEIAPGINLLRRSSASWASPLRFDPLRPLKRDVSRGELPTPFLPKAGRVRGGHCSLIGRMRLPDL